jgi:hypothetical protein
MDLEKMLGKLGDELINSPYLSVMIVNKKYQIVWNNQRFADEFNKGNSLLGKPCFHAIGDDTVHENCPLQKSIREGSRSKGFLDFGDRNFFFLSIPLDEEHAAKVHIFLPKEPDGIVSEK